MIYDMMYLLTAIGLPPGGSSTVHIYTQTIHRTTQNKQYIDQHKYFGRVRAESEWNIALQCSMIDCKSFVEPRRKLSGCFVEGLS
jgi:hypothetical protein